MRNVASAITATYRRRPRKIACLPWLPHLWGYARDLFQQRGFGETIDFGQIKRHYYLVHTELNPSGIVPLGPEESGWHRPPGREGCTSS